MKRLTTKEFISKAKQIYGDRFDYSETEYINAKTKLKIICKLHGEHLLLPHHHLNGTAGGGCPQCGKSSINDNKRLTQEQFIERVKDIKDLSFDKTIYIDKRRVVTVTCKIHGDYQTSAETLLKGNGCKKCASIKLQKDRLSDINYFIHRAYLIHKNNYDYSKVDYRGSFNKVLIKCNKCGDLFYQTPSVHLRGSGCSICNSSKGERKIKDLLEFLKISFITQKTFKDLVFERRLKFDFYLPDYNACIEFDGEQHFKPIEYWEGKEGFEKSQIKDALKVVYCQVNNISLLRIRFDESDIESAIKVFLKI